MWLRFASSRVSLAAMVLALCVCGFAGAPSPSSTVADTVSIVGDAAFTAETRAALALLQSRAPSYVSEVQSEIQTILSVSRGSGMDAPIRTYRVGAETAFAPGFSIEQQVAWYASTIVHDAHHGALYHAGHAWTGKGAELECLGRQRDVLALIERGTTMRDYVQSLILGADYPANQYWTSPNRHW